MSSPERTPPASPAAVPEIQHTATWTADDSPAADSHAQPDSFSGFGSISMNGQQVFWEIRQRLEEYARFQDAHAPHAPPKAGAPVYPVPDRKYILIAHINHGTYGSVWRAHHAEDPNHIVAIKFFPRFGNRQAGMVKELDGIRRLSSQKGFIQLIDFNNQNVDWPYLVMTFAPSSLEALLKDGPLPAKRAIAIFTQIVNAMAFAHSDQLGLCHCDLKPSNVLMTAGDSTGEPLITDLGQSRLITQSNRGILGSFFYMPPEQANLGNKTVDKRWDVYALGAIAYGMLVAGRPPHPSLPRKDKHWETLEPTLRREDLLVQLVEYQRALEQAGRPNAHWSVSGVDSRFASIIDRCLELKPEARFRDAVAVAEALRARKRACQRGPILKVGMVATVLAFAVVIGMGWMFQKRIVQQQQTEMIQQIQDGEEQTAAVAARLLEAKLQRRVQFLERYTDLAIPPVTPPAPGTVADKYIHAREALAQARHLTHHRHDTVLLNRWLAEDRAPVDDWLKRIVSDANKENIFPHGLTVSVCLGESVFNFARGSCDSATGEVTTANPWHNERSVRQYTRDFSYRDWYGRTGYTLNASDNRVPGHPRKPIDAPHVSVLYLSTHGTWWLSVVCPIRAVDPDTGKVEVVGLLGGPVDIDNELTKWLDKRTHPLATTTLFAGELKKIVVDDRGHLIWHPELTQLLQATHSHGGADSEPHEASDLWDGAIAEPVYARCQHYRKYGDQFQNPDGSPNEEIALFNDLWDDPIPTATTPPADSTGATRVQPLLLTPPTGTRSESATPTPAETRTESAVPPGGWLIARRAPFYPLGEGEGRKPWYVIVAVEKDDAMQPVAALQTGLLWQGSLAFAVFLALSACIWGGVLWALNSSEGSGHA